MQLLGIKVTEVHRRPRTSHPRYVYEASSSPSEPVPTVACQISAPIKDTPTCDLRELANRLSADGGTFSPTYRS
jgi:hypothetical protein